MANANRLARLYHVMRHIPIQGVKYLFRKTFMGYCDTADVGGRFLVIPAQDFDYRIVRVMGAVAEAVADDALDLTIYSGATAAAAEAATAIKTVTSFIAATATEAVWNETNGDGPVVEAGSVVTVKLYGASATAGTPGHMAVVIQPL